MPYQLKAKNILLTYAQCALTKEQLLDHLKTLCSGAIRVSEELHEDGSPHLHAYIQSTTPIRTKNERYFDLNNYHPNVQSCRDPKAAWTYVAKDGNFVDHGVFEFKQDKRKWAEVFTAETPDQAREMIKEISARDFILQNDRVESYIRKAFETKIEPFVPTWKPDQFTIEPDMASFLDQLHEVNKIAALRC